MFIDSAQVLNLIMINQDKTVNPNMLNIQVVFSTHSLFIEWLNGYY